MTHKSLTCLSNLSHMASRYQLDNRNEAGNTRTHNIHTHAKPESSYYTSTRRHMLLKLTLHDRPFILETEIILHIHMLWIDLSWDNKLISAKAQVSSQMEG